MALDEDGGLTFSLDVASDGAALLRATIMKKLSEFMGSYTDDVLAEYVVVLVGHGKHRTQAVKDLEAFLGDQSEAFVTWLWDHLSSNIHLYTSATNSPALDTAPVDFTGHDESRNPMKNMENSSKIKGNNAEKVGLGTSEGGRLISLRKENDKSKKEVDMDTLVTTQGDSSTLPRGRGSYARQVKRSRSPDSSVHTERTISEKQKRHFSPPRVNATRRLLQSAVREAVAPTTSHSKRQTRDPATSTAGHSQRSGSSMKRLQSVVSADVENSENGSIQQPAEELRRPTAARQSKRAAPAIMMAMKAAAAAAEDVSKARGRLSGNIWERLGKKPSDTADEQNERYAHENNDTIESSQDDVDDDNEHDLKRPRFENDDLLNEGPIEDDVLASGSVYDEYPGQSTGSRNIYAVKSGKYMDERYDDEDFASDDIVEEGEDIMINDTSRQDIDESVMVEYKKESHKQKGINTSLGLPNSSQKIVSVSVNVNAWKHGAYEKPKDTGISEQLPTFPIPNQSQEYMGITNLTAVNELEGLNPSDMATKKQSWESQLDVNNTGPQQPKDFQKTSTSAVLTGVKQAKKPDDAESRTVFVTNIHFAASKESVMAHFASCGDIGRIVMLTDGATGQSKGSAYIEFKTKDATDRALALNESSFYSRALKVVRKDAAIQAIQEMNPLIHPAFIRRPVPLALRLPLRGRFLRGSPFLLQRRFPAMPRPYGNFPSLQWKRDTAAAPSAAAVNPLTLNGNRPGYNVPVRPQRSLSYVRTNSLGVGPVKAGEEVFGAPQNEKDETKSDPIQDQKVDEMVDVEMEQA